MRKKIIVIVLLFIPLSIFAWFNLIRPCEISSSVKFFISETDVLSDESYNTDLYESLISQYNGTGTKVSTNYRKLVRTDGNLPSYKEKDYKRIAIDIKVKNKSIFELKNFVASIETDEHSNILFTDDNLVYENVKAFKTDDITVMWLEMYCGDMTDEEIAEYIKGLTIKVSYGNSVTGVKTENVKISDVIEIRRPESE